MSLPGSVISFNLGEGVAAGLDPHNRISARSSIVNSAGDLRYQSLTPREPFASPRPLTAMYPDGVARPRPNKRRARPVSTMLSGDISKPWLGKKDKAARVSYFLTYGVFILGLIGSIARCYLGWKNVDLVGKTCLVLEDHFDGNELNSDVWTHDIEMGGYGWVTHFPVVLR